MIDDKLQQELLDGLDRMGEMIEDLKSTSVRKLEKPEPQTGDVWEIGSQYVYVYKNRHGAMEYIYRETGGVYDADNIASWGNSATRIFSLSEYLKNKEANNA